VAAQRITYFKAILKDQPGSFLHLMHGLKAENIGLRCILGTGGSEVCAIPKDPEKLRNAWRASGILAEEGTGFFLKGRDKTGVLLKTLEALAQAGVNMKTIAATVVGGQYGSIILVDAEAVEKTARALGAK
jgi:prephenate dehydratase